MFKHGFSTIEFLSVISSAAIFASIALPSFNAMQERASELKAYTELNRLKPVIENYYTTHGSYPKELTSKELNRSGVVYDQKLIDPFNGKNYSLMIFPEKPQYFVLASSGPDKRTSVIISGQDLLNAGDDILVTNKPEDQPFH